MAFGKDKETDQKDSIKGPLNTLLNIAIFILVILLGYFLYSGVGKMIEKPPLHAEGKEEGVKRLIQVKVYNGCGIKGLGEKVTEYLRKNNFDVIDSENYSSFDVEETLVIDNRGNKENALHTAQILGVDPKKNLSENINEDYLLDVVIIIGKDYKILKPFDN